MIKIIIKKYRNQIVAYNLMKDLSIAFSTILVLLNLISFFENIFYFTSINREKLFFLLTTIILILTIYSILHFIICYLKLFKNLDDITISKKIGIDHPNIKDELTNIIQIQKNNQFNKHLVSLATKKINIKLKKNLKNIYLFKYPYKHIYQASFILIITIFSLFLFKVHLPLNRIINYNQIFDVPTPFNLNSEFGNFSALEGDSIYINIKGIGNLPDSITLFLKKKDIIEQYQIPNADNIYQYLLINESGNIVYWAEYLNKFFFSKWDKILTLPDTINIKERPKIIKSKFSIEPPQYTKQSAYKHNKPNVTQIETLEGSKINLEILTNKNLTSAWIVNHHKDRINLNVKNNIISHEFILNENNKFSIFCLDESFVSNINPTQYTFIAKKDNAPKIIIKSPEENFELDESYNINVDVNLIDDIGISKVWIEHSVYNSDFPEFNKKIDTTVLYRNNDLLKNNLLIKKEWDISKMNLLMGDELHFYILAQDNNILKENITRSQLFIGTFPSLENIFSEINSNQEQTFDSMEDIQESIENISKITDDMKLDLLKSEEISWEEKKQLENTFTEINKIKEDIKSIQNSMEKVLENADANNLFDKNLSEKFEHLQNILQNIMSSELQEAIQKLQDAIQNTDMNEIMEALENYEFNIEKFEEQIDRFIDMFELALAEQKINEISEHLENMINKQNELISNINNDEKSNFLSKKSNKQENRFNNLESLLNEAGSLVENVSDKTLEEINNLLNDPLINNTKESLSKQTEEINKSNKKSSLDSANEANENFKDISDIINELKKQFNDENKEKMSKEFIRIINSMFSISNQQEKIINQSYGIRSNSPQIKSLNRLQYNIDQELIQITSQIIDLSNKTFFINPKINRAIGQLKTSISKSISYFEQKQINNGKKEQKNIIQTINTITALLLNSMQEMKNSQMTSGFEQFMESLKEISDGQKGVNQGTMQMNGMGMMQQTLMEQLQKQQQALKEKLEELLGNNPGKDQGGGLHQSKEEMDEIIKDLINNKVTQKTIERQQKILSRMLDSQKSLQQKDYEKKRESMSATNFEYIGPLGLPNDLGEKDLLLMKALESAIKENLPLEYNNLMQTYFLNMQNNNDKYED